jgi:hypothetical protein
MYERTFIGLDVHARSVKAGVLDDLTGEVNSLAVPVATQPLVAWVCAQPDPAVACEAGPTGYELARALDARGVQILGHAALSYSWISPPRRSRRWMSGTPSAAATGAALSGAQSCSPRCGRFWL